MLTKEEAFGMYMGQKIYFPSIKEIHTLGGITSCGEIFTSGAIYDGSFAISDSKLILRTFEDMTDEEMDTITNLINTRKNEMLFSRHNKHNYILTNSEVIEYLISIGIDIFNLKERGWAIYESDLKGENNENN